jgi:hypothetical protein
MLEIKFVINRLHEAILNHGEDILKLTAKPHIWKFPEGLKYGKTVQWVK